LAYFSFSAGFSLLLSFKALPRLSYVPGELLKEKSLLVWHLFPASLSSNYKAKIKKTNEFYHCILGLLERGGWGREPNPKQNKNQWSFQSQVKC